ncbi:hypothetical protein ACFE04_007565 [Oxalis oulophora]
MHANDNQYQGHSHDELEGRPFERRSHVFFELHAVLVDGDDMLLRRFLAASSFSLHFDNPNSSSANVDVAQSTNAARLSSQSPPFLLIHSLSLGSNGESYESLKTRDEGIDSYCEFEVDPLMANSKKRHAAENQNEKERVKVAKS